MKYLVLYESEMVVDGNNLRYWDRNGDMSSVLGCVSFEVSTWREFDNKKEAIEFARQNKGVIVEAFEWDIKKEAKK